MCSVTAILLTAGLSSRMKRCKLNLPFKSHTIIEEVISQLSSSKVAEIVVVTGHYKEEIEGLIQEDNRIKLVHNPDYKLGMTTSIKCGIKSAAAGSTGYMICLGDMPFIQKEDYNTILNKFQKERNVNPTIIRPFFNEKPGNPTVFSRHFKDNILDLEYKEGARPLLKEFIETVVSLAMETDSTVKDIDTSVDYEKLK